MTTWRCASISRTSATPTRFSSSPTASRARAKTSRITRWWLSVNPAGSCCSPATPPASTTAPPARSCRTTPAPWRTDPRETIMQLGFNLPISGPTSAARSFASIAQQGEAMGYDYLTLTDHVVLPDVSVPGYPYSESGEFMSNTPTERHELLTATAFIAAKTSHIRLVLAVLVVPHRPAVLAAKMLSTIDVLSEGRLVIGIGAGWLKAEFDAVVTTPFAERGAVTDEYLEAFRALWTQEHAIFDGRYTKFSDL